MARRTKKTKRTGRRSKSPLKPGQLRPPTPQEDEAWRQLKARFEKTFPGFVSTFTDGPCETCMTKILEAWGGGPFRINGTLDADYLAIFDCVVQTTSGALIYEPSIDVALEDPKTRELRIVRQDGTVDAVLAYTETEFAEFWKRFGGKLYDLLEGDHADLTKSIVEGINANRNEIIEDTMGCRPTAQLAHWQEAWLATLLDADAWHQQLIALHALVAEVRGDQLKLFCLRE